MNQKVIGLGLGALLFALCSFADAQQSKVYHVGVIHQGGPYKTVVDGLQDGLRELGYENGKHIRLEIRDTKSDTKLVDEAAKLFERERVNLIYAVTTSVATAVKNITSSTPIVFTVGSDPVLSGLVQSFVKPGGRLTGVQYSTTDLTGKRLEILKEIIPKLTSRIDRLQRREPHVQRSSRFGAGGSATSRRSISGTASQFCGGAASAPWGTQSHGGGRLFLHHRCHGD